MNVLRSPPDKFPRNFPPLLDNMKCLTKLMHFVRQDNQSYSNFVHFSSRYHSIQTLYHLINNHKNKNIYIHINSFIILQQFETYRLNNAFLDNLLYSMNVIFFEIMKFFFRLTTQDLKEIVLYIRYYINIHSF